MISPLPLAELARCFRHVREAGPNAGNRVEGIQKYCGGEKGQSWCAYMATVWLDLKFGGDAHGVSDSPIPREGSTDAIYALAKKNGWLSDAPHVDDLVLSLHPGTEDAHHVALVTNVKADGFSAIAGNTSEDGLSSNGDRVAEHDFPLRPGVYVFVRYPKPWAA